jgi:hypothetical protein
MLQEKDKKYVSFEINGEVYPRSGKNGVSTEGIDPEAYIIAPSFVKTPHGDIEHMMIQVFDIARKAENFIIIGCGLREEDSFLWLLLTSYLYHFKNNRKLIIVDPYAEEIKTKICDRNSMDIKKHVNIKLFSNKFEVVFEQLINELHENIA